MFELKPIARQVILACGGLATAAMVAVPAAAQTPPSSAQSLEKITITGSNIRRTDAETVSPVEIITREDIERSGKPTIAEVLRNVPAATGGSYGESFSNSFAAGAAGISLRGLGQKTTLVLINGRRTAGYGFAQNLQDTFVDLNSIPTSAVERIEILKDGASAIYGSDAIAGVVNVILRRDFKGIEASAGIGTSEGENDYRASITAGFGDLGSQKFNVFGVLDYYKRDELLLSDTKFGEDRDYRGEAGGRNFQGLTTGGTWTGVPGSATQNLRRAISNCSALGGRVLDYAGAVNAGLLGGATSNPASANALANLLAVPLGTGFNLPGNTWCAYDINKALAALPATERVGFLGRGVFDFAPNVQGYAELGLSQVKTEQTFTPPFYATTGLQPTAQGLQPFAYNINHLPGASGNPLPVNARFAGNLIGLGTRDAEITSDSYRVLAGLKYSFAGWDFDSGAGWSKNEVEQINKNRLSKSQTNALFGINPTPAAPTGVSAGSACNLDAPLSTLGACQSMSFSFPRKSVSELTFVDTKASTEFGSLPGGPIGVAVGIEFRDESLKDTPDPRAQSGDVLGQGITATDGSRNNTAGFIEFALPLTKELEAQLALRGDHYSDFGNAVTPKVGLKYRPNNQWLLRANWGRGFRAPSLPEISPSVATFFTQVNDPLLGTAPQISGVFAGNPALNAEKSRSATIGFVFEPTANFNVSLDWYEISWNNIVAAPSFATIVDDDVNVFGRQLDATCSGGDPRVQRDPTNNCTIITVFSNYQNFNKFITSGADIDLRWTIPSAYGKFITRLGASYVDEFDEVGTDCAGHNGCTYTYPRWRGNVSLDFERGPLVLTGRVNYIHGYWQDGLAATFFDPSTANTAFQTGAYPLKVPSYTTLDLYARYAVTPKLTINGSIINVTDETPPYDPWGNGLGGTYLYDPGLYDVRGIQYRIGVTYKF